MRKFKSGLWRNSGKEHRWVFLLSILSLCIIFACSRPIKPKSEFITIKLGDRTFTRYFDLMPKVDFEGDESIRLSDFIDSVVTEYPEIYAYRVIGSDGFYPALKGSPDNTWEHMQKGYLKLSNRMSTFEPSLGFMGRYYVKDVVSIELLRKIDVKLETEKDTTFLIIDIQVNTYSDPQDEFYNGREGIRLSDFIEPFIASPEDYSYKLISLQEDEKTFSWSEIQTGWWLVDLDLTKFNPDLGPDSRMQFLLTIELTPKLK
jgi:hypothetical protein